MFCKWCGNTIQTTDQKCSSCGRETPPLSDCGGFYDLKRPWEGVPGPQAEQTDPKPEQEMPKLKEKPVPEEKVKPEPEREPLKPMAEDRPGPDPEVARLREENRAIRKAANIRHKRMLIICGALAVALIVVLILFITAKTGDKPQKPSVPVNNEQVSTTEGTQGTSAPTTGTTVPAESDPTEPTVAEPITVTATLLRENDSVALETEGSQEAKVSEIEKGVDINFYWAKKAENEDVENVLEGIEGNAAFDYENADRVELMIRWDEEKIDMHSCNTMNMTGFTGETECVATWAWSEDNENFTAIEESGIEKELAFAKVNELELPETIYLQCQIVVTNEQGNTLTIVLSGFQVERSGDQYEVSVRNPLEAGGN